MFIEKSTFYGVSFIILLLNTLLMIFLTIPNNKRYNELREKNKRGEKLTEAEINFVNKAWTTFWIVFNILFYFVGIVIGFAGYTSRN